MNEWFKKHSDTAAIIGVLFTIFIWMHGEFGTIDGKFEKMNDRFRDIDTRLGQIEGRLIRVETVLIMKQIMPNDFMAQAHYDIAKTECPAKLDIL